MWSLSAVNIATASLLCLIMKLTAAESRKRSCISVTSHQSDVNVTQCQIFHYLELCFVWHFSHHAEHAIGANLYNLYTQNTTVTLLQLPQLTAAQNGGFLFSFQNSSNCVTWMRFPSGLIALQEKNALAERTAYPCLPAQRIDKFWHVKSTCV